jgi:hypothetical protein
MNITLWASSEEKKRRHSPEKLVIRACHPVASSGAFDTLSKGADPLADVVEGVSTSTS